MPDNLTPKQRSECMRAVRGKNTTPEMLIRRALHSLGYRYALHRENLPGKPDLVFVSRRKVVFVHGCFWHMHNCRHGRIPPVTNRDYWSSKREKNKRRDKKHIRELRADGWQVLVVWECWRRDLMRMQQRLIRFLEK